jgi:protein ImuB
LAENGTSVTVDDRGALSGAPTVLVDADRPRPIDAWAGPWPVDEHAWDASRRRRACRFQVVDVRQTGWLLVLEGDQWWAEGRYD